MLAKNAFTCTRCDPCIPCVRIGVSIYFCTAWRVRRAYARANCARQTTVQSIIRHLSGRLPSIGVTKGHWKVLSPPQKHFWGGETIKCSEKNLRWLLCNGHYIYICVGNITIFFLRFIFRQTYAIMRCTWRVSEFSSCSISAKYRLKVVRSAYSFDGVKQKGV